MAIANGFLEAVARFDWALNWVKLKLNQLTSNLDWLRLQLILTSQGYNMTNAYNALMYSNWLNWLLGWLRGDVNFVNLFWIILKESLGPFFWEVSWALESNFSLFSTFVFHLSLMRLHTLQLLEVYLVLNDASLFVLLFIFERPIGFWEEKSCNWGTWWVLTREASSTYL